MFKYPGEGGYKEHYRVEEVVEDFTFKDDCHYNKGSSFQVKPGGHYNPHPKHNYSNHNDIHGDSFKDGRDGYSVHFSEARYEKEQYPDPWNHRNDYPDHGGKHHNAYKYQSNAPDGIGVTDGGYGVHHRPQHHQFYGEEKPFWNSKGISD